MRQQWGTKSHGNVTQPGWGRSDLQPKDSEPEEFTGVEPEDQYPEEELFDPRRLNPNGVQ